MYAISYKKFQKNASQHAFYIYLRNEMADTISKKQQEHHDRAWF